MGERTEERKEQYKRIRMEFEDLQIEDKALFLLEATVATVARGIEQAGKGLADEIDKAFRSAAREAEAETTTGPSDAPTDGEGPPAANAAPEKKTKPPKPAGDNDASTL